ncbi:hypothetical protein ACFL96_12850 [Thermoproteota archaeon]
MNYATDIRDLKKRTFVEAVKEHPWTKERLLHLARNTEWLVGPYYEGNQKEGMFEIYHQGDRINVEVPHCRDDDFDDTMIEVAYIVPRGGTLTGILESVSILREYHEMSTAYYNNKEESTLDPEKGRLYEIDVIENTWQSIVKVCKDKV